MQRARSGDAGGRSGAPRRGRRPPAVSARRGDRAGAADRASARALGRRHHLLVPGTVTINGTPYICDLDSERFVDCDAFVAHLRTAHHTAPARIPDLLL